MESAAHQRRWHLLLLLVAGSQMHKLVLFQFILKLLFNAQKSFKTLNAFSVFFQQLNCPKCFLIC
jgi:hypothetical protein